MKNKQGFLPNRLNKYAIRKFTVGTASLLIGATLVFGVENVAKADELDNSSTQNKDGSKDKSEPVDITELTDSSATNNKDKATTTSTETTTTVEPNSAGTSNEMTTTNTDDKEGTESAEQDTTSSDKTSKQESSSTNQSTIDNTTDNHATQDTTSTDKTTQNEKDSATNKNETTNDKQATQDTTKTSEQHKASKARDRETTKVDENDNKADVTTDKKASTKGGKVVKSSNTTKAKSDKKVAQNTKTKKDNKATKQQSNKTAKKVASKHDTTSTNNTELAKKLAKSKDKATAVNSFLKEHVSESEAKDILNNTDVNFNKASDEEINQAVLQAALIELANKQQSTETLATAPRVRTFMRAMATPVMFAAAVNDSEDVQKSLGYSSNYTFSSLVFAPGTLDSDAAKANNYIPFDIHAYMSGSNSGSRYKIDLKLDEKIADHVTKITVNPAGRSTPVEFVRLTDDNGNPSDIWEVNYIRANGGLFGGAEILKTYSATNGRIELDDTVGNILNEAGNLSNNKLNYQIYVRDSNNNTIIRTSESGGYFLTSTDSDLAALNNNKSTANSDAFRASSGTAVLDTTVGTNGAIIVDQQIVKSGTFGYGGGQNKQWSYNYQIDKDLIPFIESVELDRYDYNGLSGFDKTYNASNKVADLKIDANGNGTITASDLNNLIEFNNGLPEPVGIRVVIKLNQSPNNILTKDAQYDSNGNLITSTTDRLEDFTFAGYLTDNAGKLINNTLGTTSLGLQDYDQDGLLDSYERDVSLTDPNNADTDGDGKNDGDEVKKYLTSPLVGTPQVADITINDTKVSGSVPLQPNAGSQTAKVINPAGQVIGTSAVNSDGTFTVTIPKSAAGQYTIAIDAANYPNDETSTFNIIDNTIVPAPLIDPVDDNDTTIGVRGTAGSTITVKDNNNNVIGTVTLGANSTTGTLTLTKPLTAGTQLTSTATKNGKTSTVSPTVTVTDATAPDAPVINRVTSEDTTVKGTAEPNSTVTVIFPNGTTQVTTADSSGNYTVNIPSSLDLTGSEVIKATATDAAGNKSVESNTTVVDTTAPNQPTVNRVTSEDTTITGKAEPNSTVTVTFPNGTTVQAITTTDGSYRVAVPTNIDLKGGENLTVTATDKAGNTSTSANTTVVDVTPPAEPTINTVTSQDTTITGKAEPNSTVTITFPDGTTATGTTDQNGNYTVNIPNTIDLKGDEELSAVATDAAGNKSVESGTTVLDKTAPDAPTVNPVTSEDTTITGKSEPFATITVTFPDGTTATGTADEDGNYVVDIPSSVDLKGGETLPVTSTDEAGNVSAPANTVVTDTTAPTAPTVNPVTSEDTTITGKAEPNSTVTVTFPDGTTATGTADEDGNYVVDIPTNVDLKGGETLPVTSTDEAGNESQPANTVVTDTTAPTAPTVNPVTSEDKTITGKAEPNSTVTVTFPDGTTATGTADEDGNYVVDIPTNVDLKGGETLPVTSTDEAGNESQPSSTVVTDTTAPTAPTVNPVTSEDKTITGKAEPNSTVTVTFPDGTTATGTADEDGNYVVDIPTNVDLKGGETLPVTSTDEAGNESSPASTVVTDTTAPTAPTVNPVTSEDTTITGKAEPNSTVTVTFPDGTTATGIADEDGNYVVDIPTSVDLKGGETLPVTSTDEAGNESNPANTVVTDTTAPTAPTVNPVTSEDTTITGKAEPNSTVTVTFPDGTTATGTADEDGNYVVDIPTNVDLKGGETLPVTSTDEAGNVSDPASTVVTDATAPTTPTVNPVTSEDKTITGKAEPNSTVTVTFPDGTTATGTADEDGNYVVDIPTNVDLKGGETLPVTATDEAGNESQPSSTVVTDTTAPIVKEINDQTKEVNTPIDEIKIEADDGAGHTVTNSVSGLPAGVTFDENTNTISGSPTIVGTYPVTVTTTDAEGNATETKFTITVVDTTAPTVKAIDDQTKEVNTPIDNIVIDGSDNSGQPVTNSVSGLPDGVTFDSETNIISGSPTTVGTYPVTVTTTDAEGNTTTTKFTITVVDTTAPTVKAIDDQTKEVNTPIDNIVIDGQDNSGQPVTNSVSGLPVGVTFDEATNTISGSPTTVGTYPVTVTTTDAEGNTTETKFTITVVDTTAPTVKDIDDQTKEVNTPIDNIVIDGSDNSGQPVTNSVSGLPNGVTFDEATNTISGSPTTVGTYPVTVTTTDAEGNTTTTKFTITVIDTTAPTVKAIDDQTKEVNTPIDNIVIDGQDNSGQPVTNSVSGLPEGVTFDENTNTISGSPTTVGTYPVTVTTTDAEGNTTTTQFTITVVDTTAPTVKAIDDQTKEVNTPIDNIVVDGSDNSGQPVKNSVSGLPEGVTFDEATNTISGSPTTVGTYPVTVTTTDAEGNTTETKFTITVVDTTAPTVKAIDDQTKEVNTPIDNIVIDSQDNSGQPVTNSVSGLPNGVTFDENTNTISGSPTTVGTYPVTVTTTDAEGNTTETKFTITVVDTTAPTVKDIDDQTKEVNTPIDSITIDSQDNSGQPVTNSVSGLPEGVTFDENTNTISGSPTTVGTYPVTVTTTDAEGNTTTTQFTITVVDTTAPTVKAINDQTKEVNTPIDNIVIDGSDNSGQPVTNSVSGLPNGVTFDEATNTISGSPTTVGTYPVTVTTTDAEGNTTETKFTITVVDTTAPTVKAIDDQIKEVNTPIDNIVIDSQDNSGQPVTNSVSGLPEGVTFDEATNTISGSPTMVGTYPVTVTTTDAEGNTTTTQFTITVVDTTAPTVKAIDDQTKEVNTPIDNIVIDGSDNSGQPVTNSVSGLPDGVTFDSETNIISGSPTTVGTYPVTVTTTDAEGNTTTTQFTITVVDTTAPTVKAIDDQIKEVNTPIDNIVIDSQDNSGQPVTNSVSGLPEGVTFDEATNTISGSPTMVGTYPVTVTTTDAEGNTTTTKFTITVVDTTAPTVKDIDDQTKEVNTPIDNIVIDGSDNSGQPVTNSVSGLPEGVTFDEATNTISGSPTTVGTYPVTVTTTDGEGNTTETKFTITVVDTTAPTVKAIDDQTKEVNTPIDNIVIDGSDNSGQPVTNSVSGLPDGVTFDSETNIISGSPTTVGTYPVTVTTTDAEGNTTETKFTITVVDTTAPTVKAIDDQTKEVNTPIDNIVIDGSDNSGQPVTNSVSGLPNGVTFDETTNTISGSPTTVGTYPVTVTTTDAEGNTTETKFTITVVDTTAPTVKAIDDQTKEVNTPIDNIVIDGSDNSDQPVTNSVSGLPAGVTFDETTNTISGSPTTVGTYPVTVTTTDAEGNTTETKFTITVVDTTAPTVKAIDDQTKEVNTPIDSITIDGQDNSGQPVTNSVSGLPNGVTFDEATNTISGSPTTVGTYPVTVTTTDAEGNTTTTQFTITVVDTTAPTVKAIDDQTREVNTPIDNIVIDSQDNSGQPVTNSVSGLPAGVTFDESTNTISGSPTTVGTYPVTVTTTDAEGNTTETQFTITVVDTTAPTVKAIDDQTKEVNTPIDNIVIDSQDNSGQPVTNSVSDLPEGVTFDEATNTISGIPTTVGTYPVIVTTTDAEGNTTTTKFTITVIDTTAPTVKAIDDQTKEVNTPIDNIVIEGSDNSGQPVTNSVSGLPNGVTFDEATNTISGSPTTVGTYPVTVTTTDAEGNTTTTQFTITVVDTTAPTVKDIDDQTKEVNTPIDNIVVDGSDNSGQPVTNSVSGLPEGVTFDEATNTISGSPTMVGTYPVTVTTTDAEGNTTETKFTITVVDTTAPTVKAIDDQTKEVNTPIDNIVIDGSDNSGQPVRNSVSGLPAGVTFDSETNTISGSPTTVGTYPVTVTTTDAEGNTTETQFTITVVDTTAPTVKAIDDQTKEVNTPIDNIVIDGQDNGGQPVTNSVSGLPNGVTFDEVTNTISGSPTTVGTYPVTVTTTDAEGNTTTTQFTITVIDTTAPDAPTINPVHKGDTTITGKAEPKSTVTITFPDGTTATGTTDADGNYTIDVPSNVHLNGGDHINAIATDKSGNDSPAADTIVIDDSKPVDPDHPTDPTDPTDPVKPTDPSHPTKPNQPTQPSQPGTVVPPSTPKNDRPSNDHHNNAEPSQQQNTSDNNMTPTQNNHRYSRQERIYNESAKTHHKKGNNKATANKQQSELPETGDSETNKGTLFGSLLAGLGALFLFFKRRKEDEDTDKEQ